MGITGRDLYQGDAALTDYNGIGMTIVEVVSRREQRGSQSGIQYQVKPALRNGHPGAWYDADWFEPNAGLTRSP